MRSTCRVIGATVLPPLLAISLAVSAQSPRVASVDEKTLREYAGAYQWGSDAFLYLQLWSEFTGTNQLVDELGGSTFKEQLF